MAGWVAGGGGDGATVVLGGTGAGRVVPDADADELTPVDDVASPVAGAVVVGGAAVDDVVSGNGPPICPSRADRPPEQAAATARAKAAAPAPRAAR